MLGQLRGLVLAVVISAFAVISIPEVIARRGTFDPTPDESAANVPLGTIESGSQPGSQVGYGQGGGAASIVGEMRFPPPMPQPPYPLPFQQPVNQPASQTVSQPGSKIIARGSSSNVKVLIEVAIKIMFILGVAVLTAFVAATTGHVIWGLTGVQWNDTDRTRDTYGRPRYYDAEDMQRANQR